jgi:hypothetical protein
MKNYIAIIITIFIFLSCKKETSIILFNGTDLDGWHMDVPLLDSLPQENPPFLVRDGKLVSLGEPRGHLITNKRYSNYKLEIEYRFVEEGGNCGVLVHASKPRALYKMFPKSIEVQMEHQNAGDFWVIAEDITCDAMEERRGPKETWGISEGKNRRIMNLTEHSEKPLGEWNTMVIDCIDDTIKVWVNDELVNYGYHATVTSGQIAVQAEGTEVEFKSIVLTPLPFK